MMKSQQLTNNSRKRKERFRKWKLILTQLGVLFLGFLTWELLANIGVLNPFLFSKPSAIWNLFLVYVRSGELLLHVWISFYETVLGLVIGTLLGLFIAMFLWWFPRVARVMDPFLVVLNALPKTALAPILIIWAGTGIKGIVVVAISLSLIITVLSAYTYFNGIEEDKITMLRTFGANKWQIFNKLVLPANSPNIINTLKINIGMSWVGVIVGEFLVSRYGIGYLVVYGSQVFRMDLVMMGVMVLAVLAFIMYEIVNLIERYYRKKRLSERK